MKLSELTAVSPIDGRYRNKVLALDKWFSEFGFIRSRVRVEVEYLSKLLKMLGLKKIKIDSIWRDFSLNDAKWIKDKEKETRHDVKAIEYFLRRKLGKSANYIHIGLTSYDITTCAYALSLFESKNEVIIPAIKELEVELRLFSSSNMQTVMLGRTHGQPAVPTTMGKEVLNFLVRIKKIRKNLTIFRFESKLSGAVGNFNALVAAYPKINWLKFSDDFIKELGMVPNHYTTQILPYDNWLEYFNELKLLNSVLIGFCQDIWRYISDNYLIQKMQKKEVGSSTMPQKINPINFENAEGNLGIANSLFEFYERKLPISRLQRDLSDSTVKRTFGVAIAHSLLAYQGIIFGLKGISVNKTKIALDLDDHWECIAEGVQTILRTTNYTQPYEKLKELTRGKKVTKEDYIKFIREIEVPDEIRKKLERLSPQNYTGLAEKFVI